MTQSIALTARELTRIGGLALEQVHEAVGIISPDIRYVWVNDEFCRLTGYAREEIVGQPVRILRSGLHDDAHYDEMFRSVQESGRWQGEVWRRKKAGEAFPALLTISAVRDEDSGVEYFVDLFIDIDRVRDGRERLEFLINHDALTELPNRRLFWDRLDLAIKRAQRTNGAFSLIFIDLDDFKQVNDTLGHLFGDRMLMQVAKTLVTALREADTIARVGGDEFVVIQEGHHASSDGATALQRVEGALEEAWSILPDDMPGGASLGLAVFPRDGSDGESLYSVADTRMYAKKRVTNPSPRE